MRATRWLAPVVLAACGTLEHDNVTAYRCDDTRDACPEGERCAFGRCRRGGATGEVRCGAATCTPMEQCCVDLASPPRCIPAGDVCPGRFALCDGAHDCQPGDLCCSDAHTTCRAADEPCQVVACAADGDCPSRLPRCCGASPIAPWGQCFRFGCPTTP